MKELVRQFRAIAGNVRGELDRLESIVAQLVERQEPEANSEDDTIPLAELLVTSAATDLALPTELPLGLPDVSAETLSVLELPAEKPDGVPEELPSETINPLPTESLEPGGITAKDDSAPESEREEVAPLATVSSSEAVFQKGVRLLHSGDAAQAIAFFAEAIQRDPGLVGAYLERGQAYRQRGELVRAVADFTMALTLKPREVEAYIRRGNAFTDQGRLDEAIADYTTAMGLAPDQPLVYMNRALARARQGKYGYVIEDAGTALRLNARLSGARFVRGVAFANLGRPTEALADFDQLIREEPHNALAYNERGLLHARTGDYAAAIADYNCAVQIDSRLLLPRYNRGLAYRLKGDQEQAVAEFTELLRRRPRNASALYQRGLANLALARLDQALADFDAALEQKPDSEEARIGRRRALRARAKCTPRPRVPVEIGIGPGRRANADASQALKVTCPGCGTSGQVRWDRLGGLLQCTTCDRHYRMGNDGAMEPVEVTRGIWVTVRSFLPGATRHWVPLPKDEQAERQRKQRRRRLIAAAAVLFLAIATSGGFILLRSAEAAEEPLPEELQARAERFAQAWVARDQPILRRLTSHAHDRILRSWLTKHPAPAPADDLASLRVNVRMVKERGARAELTVDVGGIAGEKSSVQLRQHWERHGGIWFFIPPQERSPAPPIKGVASIGVKPATPAGTPAKPASPAASPITPAQAPALPRAAEVITPKSSK